MATPTIKSENFQTPEDRGEGGLFPDSYFTDESPIETPAEAISDVEAQPVKDVEIFPDSFFTDEPKDQPSFPAGGGKMENEDNEPEKQEKDKGTVIAESTSKNNVRKEATRIAGRMLEAGRINVSDLASKIDELCQYKVAQLSDLEKGIFASKGLATVADGIESPVVIGEASNQREANSELSNKLVKLFSLNTQNDLAQGLDASELRSAFDRR